MDVVIKCDGYKVLSAVNPHGLGVAYNEDGSYVDKAKMLLAGAVVYLPAGGAIVAALVQQKVLESLDEKPKKAETAKKGGK